MAVQVQAAVAQAAAAVSTSGISSEKCRQRGHGLRRVYLTLAAVGREALHAAQGPHDFWAQCRSWSGRRWRTCMWPETASSETPDSIQGWLSSRQTCALET